MNTKYFYLFLYSLKDKKINNMNYNLCPVKE